jgi:hypothetical protein
MLHCLQAPMGAQRAPIGLFTPLAHCRSPDQAAPQFDLSQQASGWLDLTGQVVTETPLARMSFGMCVANGSIYLFGGNAAGAASALWCVEPLVAAMLPEMILCGAGMRVQSHIQAALNAISRMRGLDGNTSPTGPCAGCAA